MSLLRKQTKNTLIAFLLIGASTIMLLQAKEFLAARLITIFLGDSLKVTQVARLTLGKITTLQLSDLALIDEKQNAIEIKSLQISIDLLHLITTSQLLLPKIETAGITVNLTQWTDTQSKPTMPDWLNSLMVQNIMIRDAKVLYRDADQNINAHFEQIELIEHIADMPLDLAMSGFINEVPFYAAGTLASSTPFSQSRDFSFNLLGVWDQLTISASGQIDPAQVIQNSAVRVEVDSPKAKQILDLLGADEMRDGRLSAKLLLASDAQGINLFTDVSIGDFHATSSAIIRSRDQINFTFSISGSSLFEAGAVLDYLDFSKTPFQFAGKISKDFDNFELTDLNLILDEGTLTGSISLPKYPKLVDAKVNVIGYNFSPIIFSPISGSCRLPDVAMQWKLSSEPTNSKAHIIDIDIEGGEYGIKASGDIKTNFKFKVKGFTLLDIGECFGIPTMPSIPVALSGNAYSNLLDWHIPVFRADSTLANLTGSVHWANNNLSTSFKIETEDLKNLISNFAADTGPLANIPASATIRLDGALDQLVLTSATMSLGLDAKAKMQGIIGNLQTLEDVSLIASFSGPNLRTILPDLEATKFTPQPFEAQAKIRYQESEWVFRDLIAKVVNTKVSGTVSLPSQSLTNLHANLEIEGLNLENLAGPWLSYSIPPLPYQLSLQLDHKRQQLNMPELEGNIGDHHFSMQLLWDGSPDVRTSSGFVRMHGESSQEFLRLINQGFEHIDNPYQFRFSISNSAKVINLKNMTAALGQSEFSGDIDWRSGVKPLVTANIKSSALYLPTFFPSLSADKSGQADSKQRLFSNEPLNFGGLNVIDSNIEIEAEKIYFSPDVSTSLSLHVFSSNGILQTNLFNWHGNLSNGSAKLVIDTSNTELTTLALDITSDRIPLLWFLGGVPLASNHTTLYAMSVNSVGQTQAELMKNLDGRAIFHGGGGTLKTKGLDWMFGDFISKVGRELVNREKSTGVTIQCTAAGLEIDSGVVTISPALAIRTEKLDVFITGNIDLGIETSDLYINTRARTGLGLSVAKIISPRTRVSGPLHKPTIQPDLARSAISGGAAFLSGGMSILASGILDRVRAGSINPCQSVFDTAKEKPENAQLLLSTATAK